MNTASKLLLHVCCGPCSTHVWPELFKRYQEVTAFFFNPNIQPENEYQLRLEAMREVASRIGAPLIVDDSGAEDWSHRVAEHLSEPEGGQRCRNCIGYRLTQTFIKAKELGYGAVTTTLTVSRHKNSRMILALGRELGERFDIPFFDQDFKKMNGTLFSDRQAREWGLYRQTYCGCLSSFQERQKHIKR